MFAAFESPEAPSSVCVTYDCLSRCSDGAALDDKTYCGFPTLFLLSFSFVVFIVCMLNKSLHNYEFLDFRGACLACYRLYRVALKYNTLFQKQLVLTVHLFNFYFQKENLGLFNIYK